MINAESVLKRNATTATEVIQGRFIRKFTRNPTTTASNFEAHLKVH